MNCSFFLFMLGCLWLVGCMLLGGDVVVVVL